MAAHHRTAAAAPLTVDDDDFGRLSISVQYGTATYHTIAQTITELAAAAGGRRLEAGTFSLLRCWSWLTIYKTL